MFPLISVHLLWVNKLSPISYQYHRDENAAKNLRQEGLRILSTNTEGHSEFQACGETLRLVNTCIKKQVSVNQESPATLP